MEENTFTFTARSGSNPDKSATFTLNNGSVSVELGNVLVEQISKAYDSFSDEEAVQRLSSWFKPTATGTLQKMIEPISIEDFDAEMSGDALQTTAWIRAGGLRLAPVMMTWQDVDNPRGAQAFVDELQDRICGVDPGLVMERSGYATLRERPEKPFEVRVDRLVDVDALGIGVVRHGIGHDVVDHGKQLDRQIETLGEARRHRQSLLGHGRGVDWDQDRRLNDAHHAP